MVSDLGDGAEEYRGIQEQIRSGETDLAVTGTKIESASGQLATGIGDLEQAIIGSTGTEPGITAIIQRVRSRTVDLALYEEWRNRRTERTGGGADPDS
ncbi:MAG: hypothetical protein LBH32_06175 [Dysgonamonadaceae bacterium]|nr:hypothetical protein [Dysgonamonadaceae bacterium]